jgi:hypothetical protein
MKKIIITLALLLAAVCVNAQNLSVLSKAARMAYDYLSSEGYKPTIDEDDDVLFKAEGFSFYVDNDKSDDTYLQIVLPFIMELKEDDLLSSMAAMAACNQITQDKKIVQAYITDDGDVMLCTDTYIGSAGNMNEFIDSSIAFMIRAVSAFHEEYKSMMED